MYERLVANGVRWWTSPRFRPLIADGPFRDFDRACAEATLVKDLRSKRTLEMRSGAVTWIIKLYKATSVWRRIAAAVGGSKARRELAACREVLKRGVPTVPVDAVAERSGGSAVVIEKLEGWTSVELALRGRLDDALIRRYGAFARRVHDAGILQDDFNPSNVLLNGNDMRLIDFERLAIRASVSETARLRLIAKLVRLPTIGRQGLGPFLDGYLRAGEDREATLARLLQCADRQADIDRTRLARNCLRENRNFGRFDQGRYEGWFRKAQNGRDGLTAGQASALADRPSDFRYEPHDDAFDAWRQANLGVLNGGAVPMAVLRERPGRRGFVAYRARRSH